MTGRKEGEVVSVSVVTMGREGKETTQQGGSCSKRGNNHGRQEEENPHGGAGNLLERK